MPNERIRHGLYVSEQQPETIELSCTEHVAPVSISPPMESASLVSRRNLLRRYQEIASPFQGYARLRHILDISGGGRLEESSGVVRLAMSAVIFYGPHSMSRHSPVWRGILEFLMATFAAYDTPSRGPLHLDPPSTVRAGGRLSGMRLIVQLDEC